MCERAAKRPVASIPSYSNWLVDRIQSWGGMVLTELLLSYMPFLNGGQIRKKFCCPFSPIHELRASMDELVFSKDEFGFSYKYERVPDTHSKILAHVNS